MIPLCVFRVFVCLSAILICNFSFPLFFGGGGEMQEGGKNLTEGL